MLSKQVTDTFHALGEYFASGHEDLAMAKRQAEQQNRWFTQEQVDFALQAWARSLEAEKIESWLAPYRERIPGARTATPARVGIIMAGNIPLVGLHDLLCVLAAGHRAVVKPSSDDQVLMTHVMDFLRKTDPSLGARMETTERLNDIDAVIATGSNNTNRYFEYYFGRHPHLLRGNRTSVAVLKGDESQAQLERLGEDIFRYYGLGCRNVSKLFIPAGFALPAFFEAIFPYGSVIDHNKYANNHDYYQAIYMMNRIEFLDNNFLMLKEDSSLHSPVSVLYYERYTNINDVKRKLQELQPQLQCVAGETGVIANEIPFGQAQQPSLGDYADGMDTMEFLMGLYNR